MNEPKPLPSETKLVETPRSDEAYILRLLGRIAELEQSYVKAREFIEQQDAALASLADELRLAELKGCYRLIDELKEELRLAREALKQAAEMLQASLPYWQTDERGNGPDCTPVLQAILKANAALKEPL